jgi:hypothetical protein
VVLGVRVAQRLLGGDQRRLGPRQLFTGDIELGPRSVMIGIGPLSPGSKLHLLPGQAGRSLLQRDQAGTGTGTFRPAPFGGDDQGSPLRPRLGCPLACLWHLGAAPRGGDVVERRLLGPHCRFRFAPLGHLGRQIPRLTFDDVEFATQPAGL